MSKKLSDRCSILPVPNDEERQDFYGVPITINPSITLENSPPDFNDPYWSISEDGFLTGKSAQEAYERELKGMDMVVDGFIRAQKEQDE